MVGQEKRKRYTNLSKVILASSSEIRIKMLNQYFSNVINVPHKVEEGKYKTRKRKPEEIVLRIAKEKALSVLENHPNEIIIASDQILVCENKVMSKPKNLVYVLELFFF